ncbi:IS1 family transposase, partial [Escherichia coli]|uniref:IS1 family transposase n=1 Tax=Escherichia coli TaxID=562 RepID=UPI00207C02CB
GKPPEWWEKQKGSRGIRRGQWYRLVFQFPIREQWGYVGAKSRQRWLFYAYDSLRKTVVAHVFGERTMATLGRLMSLLSPFDVVIW